MGKGTGVIKMKDGYLQVKQGELEDRLNSWEQSLHTSDIKLNQIEKRLGSHEDIISRLESLEQANKKTTAQITTTIKTAVENIAIEHMAEIEKAMDAAVANNLGDSLKMYKLIAKQLDNIGDWKKNINLVAHVSNTNKFFMAKLVQILVTKKVISGKEAGQLGRDAQLSYKAENKKVKK